MSNPASLVPFKKGKDPRRNTEGLNKGSGWFKTGIVKFMRQKAKDGEKYEDKFFKAAGLRAITKSDVLVKEINERIDGKVVQPTDLKASLIIELSETIAKKNNVANLDSKLSSE